MSTIFVIVRDERGSVLVCGHICFFTVEVSRCIVVTAIGAGFAARGVGVPEIRDGVGGRLTAKAGGGGGALGGGGFGG